MPHRLLSTLALTITFYREGTLTTSRISANTNTLISLVFAFISLLVLACDAACPFRDWTSSICLSVEHGSRLVNGDCWNSKGKVAKSATRMVENCILNELMVGLILAGRLKLYSKDRPAEGRNADFWQWKVMSGFVDMGGGLCGRERDL